MIEEDNKVHFSKDQMKESTGSSEPIESKFHIGKLFLLGVIALALSNFTPLSLFAALPLCFAFLIYGKTKTLALGGALVFLTSAMALSSGNNLNFWMTNFIFIFALGNSFLISKIIFDKMSPGEGLVRSGVIVLALVGGIFIFSILQADLSLESSLLKGVESVVEAMKASDSHQIILNAGGEDARVLKDFINNPQNIVKEILNWSFSWIFLSVFLGLWMTFLLVLRNSLIWRVHVDYPYTLEDLRAFKVHEGLVYPLIISLGLMVLPVSVLGEWSHIVGGNILYCLSVFYFFQGFGVFIFSLNAFKIFGFFRTFLVLMTLIVAWKFLAVVGLFDLWVNFRHLINKRIEKNKGE